MNDSELIFGIMSAYGRHAYSFYELEHLTAPFGVTETSLRTSLSRMIQKNMIQSEKEGKAAFYSLSQRGSRISSNIAFSFRGLDWSSWDKRWWGILFTVPDMKNPQRYAIRKKLIAYRFINLYPGFWIRPLHPKERIQDHLQSLIDSKNCTLIRFDFYQEVTKGDISRIWKLDEINHSFEAVIKTVREHLDAAEAYTPEEGLKYKLLVGNEIVNALFCDPMLPDEFLPDEWKGDELRKLFMEFDKRMSLIAKPYVDKVFNRA